ncbi:hypothetical protein QBC47DRAFT_464379 [Echria macrotheca]|uniref:Uncharacterized protein n=1 Tax=Echria macrotheca TaxID=438768 RepID=A0AAJ0F7I8_9PEZI|nr:hypothetical protein QBC47DRAFT_464379 [Echria macrotheca]
MALFQHKVRQFLGRGKQATDATTERSTIVSTSFTTEIARPVKPRRRLRSDSSSWSLNSDEEGNKKNVERLLLELLGRESPSEKALERLLQSRGHEIHLTEAIVQAAKACKYPAHTDPPLECCYCRERRELMQRLLRHTCQQHQTALATGAQGLPRGVQRALLTASKIFGTAVTAEEVLYFWGHVAILEGTLLDVIRESSAAHDVLEVLLGKRQPVCVSSVLRTDAAIRITEAWLVAAVANKECGTELLSLLLDDLPVHSGNRNYVFMTADILETAAGNETQARTIFELLSRKRRTELQITPGVLKAAAYNEKWMTDTTTIDLLLAAHLSQGRRVRITSDVVPLLDKPKPGPDSMARILHYIMEQSPAAVFFTISALDALAGLWDQAAVGILEHILSTAALSKQFVIPPSMVEAAAANPRAGAQIMELLLRERGHEVEITERVILTAMRNEDEHLRLLELLFRERADGILITERIIEAAARPRNKWDTADNTALKILLNHVKPDGFRVTTRMAEGAAVFHGQETLEMLLQATRRHDIRITDTMITKASTECLGILFENSQGAYTGKGDVSSSIDVSDADPDHISLLLSKLGESEAVQEAVLAATVESKPHHEQLLALVLAQPWTAVNLTKRVFSKIDSNEDKERCGRLIKQLLQKYGDDVRFGQGVAEDVIRQCSLDIVRLMLQIQGPGRVPLTPGMVAAVGDPAWLTDRWWEDQKQTMDVLIQERKAEFQLTEMVVEATMARSPGFLRTLLTRLLEPRARIPCLERVVLFAAGEPQHLLWDWLLNDSGQEVQITESVLERLAGNGDSGDSMLQDLFGRHDRDIHITERVLEAAAKNRKQGLAILEWLLLEHGDEICITERIMAAAATNRGKEATKILKLLLKERPHEADLTERVLEAAASNANAGDKMIDYLLREYGDDLDISDSVLAAGAGNKTRGDEIVGKLLGKLDQPILVTESVLIAAIRNRQIRHGYLEIMEKFQDIPGVQFQITSKVLEAVADTWDITGILKDYEHPVWLTENVLKTYAKQPYSDGIQSMIRYFVRSWPSRIELTEDVLALMAEHWPEHIPDLLQQKTNDIRVTPKILEARARGTRDPWTRYGSVIAYLLQATGTKVPTSMIARLGEVAAANENPEFATDILAVLLDQLEPDETFPITEGMMRAAVGNTKAGAQITDFLLRHQGSGGLSRDNKHRVSERTMEIAAANERCGEALVDMLLQHGGDRFQPTECIAQVAAGNAACGDAICELFRIRTGSGYFM